MRGHYVLNRKTGRLLLRRLLEETNAQGQSVQYQYDAADQLIAETGFDARTQRYEWVCCPHVRNTSLVEFQPPIFQPSAN
jgi:YD repeat-containing protein